MKRLLSVCVVVLLVCFTLTDTLAQSVDLKVLPISPGQRSSGYPNFTSPPAGTPNYVSTGLRTVGKGMLVYLRADTSGSGSTRVTSYSWTFVVRPSGSAAVFSNATKDSVTFTPDLAGQYIIRISVNGGAKTHDDTIYASAYRGFTSLQASCPCHMPTPTFQNAENGWKNSVHATVFFSGITGQLENAATIGYKGAYNKSCMRCHTVGWESLTDNGNFGFLANQGAKNIPPTSFDSTWWKGLPTSGGDYLISYQDQSVYNKLTPQLIATGSIGCESCHGPANDHATLTPNKTTISISADAGVCNQCHEAPKGHSIGYFWRGSTHASMTVSAAESNRNTCWPCHNGTAFIAFSDAWAAGRKITSADSAKVDPNFKSISCAVCHDPHGNSNDFNLRYTKIDTLVNGYKVPAGVGGNGQMCMNCHHARNNNVTLVKNQMAKFGDRFYPHYSPQADMYLGTNAWEFGWKLEGLNTHGGLKDGCVTCHMSQRMVVPNYTKTQSDHGMSMSENGVDKVEACVDCHGPIKSFKDIKASYDYDGDGQIESAVDEVDGLMTKLKAKLPLDATGEPVTAAADSMLVKNFATANKLSYSSLIASLFNYSYVAHDMSHGIHNTKYTVAVLRASMGLVTGVAMDPVPVPKAFALDQNYPNPFNPTTEIHFSLPSASNVKLAVYDVMGRLVRTLVDQHMDAGAHRAMWNGRDNNGQTLSSGVYFYHIQADGFASTKKMVLMK
jgi:hypothetical protein